MTTEAEIEGMRAARLAGDDDAADRIWREALARMNVEVVEGADV